MAQNFSFTTPINYLSSLHDLIEFVSPKSTDFVFSPLCWRFVNENEVKHNSGVLTPNFFCLRAFLEMDAHNHTEVTCLNIMKAENFILIYLILMMLKIF